MTTYLGYYRPTADWLEQANAAARAGEPVLPPEFLQKVAELPDKMPASCTILGSWGPRGSSAELPSVMVVETDNDADLTFITQYYQGWLGFQWTPAISIGATKAQRLEQQAEAEAQLQTT